MKTLVVISGKGGTGKTSIVAGFAALAQNVILADCDVDAANLHLLLNPRIVEQGPFYGGKEAIIHSENCDGCGICENACRFGAIKPDITPNQGYFKIDPYLCEGCGVCSYLCPNQTIELRDSLNGTWFESETRFGWMVHAKLGIASENSGKLVNLIRNKAQELAQIYHADYLLIDGSPGIGCPVIASITNADWVLVVTEPSLSAIHDLERVRKLTRHFEIPTSVCINKWDINERLSNQIEKQAQAWDLSFAGKIRYDSDFNHAQINQKPITEYKQTGVAKDIRQLWNNMENIIKNNSEQEHLVHITQ